MPTTSLLRRMPDDVRALRDPWPSRIGNVPHLTDELEQEFRFGQRITRTERGFVMGGTMKGGSSSMWYPASEDDYRAYRRWQALEGIVEARDDEAYLRLNRVLAPHGLVLVTRRQPPRRGAPHDELPFSGYGPLYAAIAAILEQLPPGHLSRPTLRRLTLGGWGPDAAKASAYEDGVVMMYDFAVRGARRTFLGLFLHELGHAHECALSESHKDALHAAHGVLADHDAFVGTEFLVDAPTRRLYQRLVFAEFVAETYMHYAAYGRALLERGERHEEPVRSAWRQVYEVYRETFAAIEYE